MFDRVVVINLARRPEKLAAFNIRVASTEWPFPAPQRFEAIDGERGTVPATWRHDPGAWGCLESHRTVLREAIRDGVQRLLVLEDDAIFPADFGARLTAFIQSVEAHDPAWELLFVGGQHSGAMPPAVAPGIARCMRTGRTHCIAIAGHFAPALLAHWEGATGHCDLALWPWGRERRIYAPHPHPIVGQAAGPSDTQGGRHHPEQWWRKP